MSSRTCTNNNHESMYHHHDDNDNTLDAWKHYLDEWTKISNNGDTIEISKAAQSLAASHSVPDELRSSIWFVISGAKQLMKKYSATHLTYQYLSSKQDTEYMSQINKDYERTFVTKDIPVIRQKIQNQLRRMLIGFANYNPDIGYAQGMNMVAAFILRQFLQHNEFFNTQFSIYHHDESEHEDDKCSVSSSTVNAETVADSSLSSLVAECDHNEQLIEEQAFWCFVCVMTNIATLFQKKLAGYHQSVKCLTSMLKKFDYTLWKHFDRMGISTVFTGVFIKWFTSLFTYPAFNLNTTQKLWDIWFLQHFDYSVFIKFAFITFQNHKEELLLMDDIEIPVFCISSKCIVTDKDWMPQLLQLQIAPLILRKDENHEEKVGDMKQMKLPEIYSLHIQQIRSIHSYGEYLLDIRCDNRTRSIWKRYTQFERLHQKLKLLGIKSDANCVFPAKSWVLSSNNESLMRQRKGELNEYLKNVLTKYNHKNQGSLYVIHEFIKS